MMNVVAGVSGCAQQSAFANSFPDNTCVAKIANAYRGASAVPPFADAAMSLVA